MPTYELNHLFPPWHFDPATTRQLKVLQFFGVPIDPAPSKGRAGGVIGRLFCDPVNKHLWTAYVYTTGDEEHSSPQLRPHDRVMLAQVVIPENWRPQTRSTLQNEKRKVFEELVCEMLKEGLKFPRKSGQGRKSLLLVVSCS